MLNCTHGSRTLAFSAAAAAFFALVLACVFALPANAAYVEVNLDGSAPVQVGNYYLRNNNDTVQISKQKNSGYKKTPMAAWNLFTNGKDAYYVFSKNSKKSLYKYTFSSGSETAIKQVKAKFDWYVSAVYKGMVYLTKANYDKSKYWTYRLDPNTGTNTKLKGNCNILDRSGAYVVAQNELHTDVSPYKISLYKITSTGLSKVKVVAKKTMGATFVGKKLYYAVYEDEGMQYASLYRCTKKGTKVKRLGQFGNGKSVVMFAEFTAKDCLVSFYSGTASPKLYRYTYSTMNLTPVS